MKDQTDRLRQLCEKLLESDIWQMSKRELFEMVLLFADRKTEPALREKLLIRYTSIVEMLGDSTNHLCSIDDCGIVLAGFAKLIRELSPAFGAMVEDAKGEKLRYSDRAANYCVLNSNGKIENICNNLAIRYYDGSQEIFRMAFLDKNNRIIHEENVAQGGVGEVYIDFQKVFAIALENKTNGMLLAHNHPDGDLTPSSADLRVTERLKEACNLMGLNFVDHIIVYNGKYRSIARENEDCYTGEIMDEPFRLCHEYDGEVGISQIDHSGAYRLNDPFDYVYQFDKDFCAEAMWDSRGEIETEEISGSFFETDKN